jgi:two-component system, sensor histidine kinase and response regulator
MTSVKVHTPTILIADHDQSSRAVMVQYLEAQGFIVREFESGIDLMMAVETEPPDLIICDWHIPHLDGPEVCRVLRADERYEHLYLILITSTTQDKELVLASDMGANDFISKPIEPSELLVRVRTGLRIAKMQGELLNQNQSLNQLNHFKSDMLAFASHELKTPIAVMRISLEMLRIEESEEGQAELLDIVDNQVGTLSELVSNFLNLRKLEEGQLEYNCKPLDLKPLVDKAVQAIEPVTRLKNQVVCVNADSIKVLADQEKLRQVIVNLLSNASKYSPNDTRIIIQMHQGANDVLLGLIDEGPGIPAEKQPQLFRRYAQLQGDYKDERFVGTGLGLVLCQEFIQGMGGSMGVHSQGHGSCFWIQLPIAHAEDALAIDKDEASLYL